MGTRLGSGPLSLLLGLLVLTMTGALAGVSSRACAEPSRPSSAKAEPSGKTSENLRAYASSLFAAGVSAAEQGRWLEAVALFRDAYETVQNPGILFNLAGAQIQAGQLVEGVSTYERFLAATEGEADSDLRPVAMRALRRNQKRLARLRLQVEDLAASQHVTLDGEAIEVPREVVLNPGEHTVLVHEQERTLTSARVTLKEGERRDLVLRVFGHTSEHPLTQPTEEASSSFWGSPLFWGVVGAVEVSGLAVGVWRASASDGTYSGNLAPGTLTLR